MQYRKFKHKALNIDPNQLKLEFLSKIDSYGSDLKNVVSIKNETTKSSFKRNFDCFNEYSLNNHIFSIQENVDFTDVNFVYYVFSRIGEELKINLLKAIKYEYDRKIRMKDKFKFLKLSKLEIEKKLSEIYDEISNVGEIKLDDFREIIYYFSKDELEELIESIEELEEVYEDNIDYSYQEEYS